MIHFFLGPLWAKMINFDTYKKKNVKNLKNFQFCSLNLAQVSVHKPSKCWKFSVASTQLSSLDPLFSTLYWTSLPPKNWGLVFFNLLYSAVVYISMQWTMWRLSPPLDAKSYQTLQCNYFMSWDTVHRLRKIFNIRGAQTTASEASRPSACRFQSFFCQNIYVYTIWGVARGSTPCQRKFCIWWAKCA